MITFVLSDVANNLAKTNLHPNTELISQVGEVTKAYAT